MLATNLQRNIFDTKVYEQIQRFIARNKVNSEHTANNYESDIRQFFKLLRDKDIEHLTEDDLVFDINEIEDYYLWLINSRKLSINTVNRYIHSVKECFRYLRRGKLVEDISFLEIKLYRGRANSYGILSVDEVKEALELVKRQGKTGHIKHALVMFAVDTSARLNECLKLKWSDFTVDGSVVRINNIGKGNKESKSTISKEFYEDLLKLKDRNSEYVFNIHRNTVQRMMAQLKKSMNISEDRNITFHSFRKVGVDYIWKTTRDLNQARKQANHSSSQTTEIYIDKEEDYGVMGLFSSSHGVDDDLYTKVDHETLLKAIGQLDKGQQMYINLKLNALQDESNEL